MDALKGFQRFGRVFDLCDRHVEEDKAKVKLNLEEANDFSVRVNEVQRGCD